MRFLINIIYSYYHSTRPSNNVKMIHKLHQRICSSKFLAKKIFKTKIDPTILKDARGFNHLFDLTSILIRNFLNHTLDKKNKKKILDLGTGRYAILSIFIKKKHIHSNVIASDINENFIRHADINCKRNNVEVKCVVSNLFQNIDDRDFDLIIWNLPYYEDPNLYLKNFFEESILRTTKDGQLILGFNSFATTSKKIEDILNNFVQLKIIQIKKYLWNNHKIILVQKTG